MAKRPLPDDFREFIECLNDRKVQYLLIGGWAVGLYGNPRLTKDIDFLISIEESNVQRLLKALQDFGGPTVEASVFTEPGNVFRMGSSPIQIDIVNEADGIVFSECYANRNILVFDNLEISTISRKDLIENKRSSARLRDLADAEYLEGSDG
jgi:hypothetical protein